MLFFFVFFPILFFVIVLYQDTHLATPTSYPDYFRNARAALPSKINNNMQSSQIVEDHIDLKSYLTAQFIDEGGGVKVRGGGRGGGRGEKRGKPSCLHSKLGGFTHCYEYRHVQ